MVGILDVKPYVFYICEDAVIIMLHDDAKAM